MKYFFHGSANFSEKVMDRKYTRGSPFSKMLTPAEAFAEAEYKTQLYGQEGLLNAISQVLFSHPHVEELSELERMEVAAYARPIFKEFEELEAFKAAETAKRGQPK